jgi:hypothetical protein
MSKKIFSSQLLRAEAALKRSVAGLPPAQPANVDPPLYALWRMAVEVAHDSADTGLLIKLLRSKMEMPEVARHMLAALLERRDLKKRRGGQRTALFKMSAQERLAKAASDVRRVQKGEMILPSVWMKYVPHEMLTRAKPPKAVPPGEFKGVPIEELMQSLKRAISSKPPKQMKREEAIEAVAKELYGPSLVVNETGVSVEEPGIDALTLRRYMDGKIGFGGNKRRRESKAR